MHRSPLLLLIFFFACTPARREVRGQWDVVRKIEFTGNGGALSGHNDLQLEQQMRTEASAFGLMVWPLMYVVTPKLLEEPLLLRDAYRLEVWYAHHGWFDARVTGWVVSDIRRNGKNRAGVVDIRGIVDPGVQSTVSELNISGMDRPTFKTLKNTAIRKAYLRQDEPFNLEYADHDRDQLANLMHDNGFAYADVDLSISARPGRKVVKIGYDVEPGISSTFGEIRISGNEQIPEKYIRERISFEPGDRYSLAKLNTAQRKLFEMGTFSVARVEPDLSDPTNPEVPVDVRVTESKWRTLRFGVGSEVNFEQDEVPLSDGGVALSDGISYSPRVTTTFKHNNVFNQLIRLESSVTAGVHIEPATNQTDAVIEEEWRLATNVAYPRIGGEKLTLNVGGLVERGYEAGDWAFRRWASDITLVNEVNRRWTVQVGPHIERYNYLIEDGARSIDARRRFGEGFEDPYVLTALDQRVIYDKQFTDQQTSTAGRGRYGVLSLREAFLPPICEVTDERPDPPCASTDPDFSKSFYIGIGTELRQYLPIRLGSDSSYALRAAFAIRAKWLLPIANNVIPYPERAFLGGANSIRGFRTKQVGPYDYLDSGDPENPYYVPRGGTLAVQPSAELRYPWLYGITWAVFADVGTLSDGWKEVTADTLRASTGVGFRYDTVVGPIRFDISFRPEYDEDRGPANDPDAEGRVYDLLGVFTPQNPDHPPYAVVFFLAIGEAI